jgi:hypothetical protein
MCAETKNLVLRLFFYNFARRSFVPWIFPDNFTVAHDNQISVCLNRNSARTLSSSQQCRSDVSQIFVVCLAKRLGIHCLHGSSENAVSLHFAKQDTRYVSSG